MNQLAQRVPALESIVPSSYNFPMGGRSLLHIGTLVVLVLSFLSCAAVNSRLSDSNRSGLALVGGTIYVEPTAEPIRDGVVLVQDGVIVEVGSRNSVSVPGTFDLIDCSGMTVTAGFWNAHVHFFELQWEDVDSISDSQLALQLENMLTRFGFTSVFDTGSNWENTGRLRERIEKEHVPGPRIRTTGEPLIAPGAMPPDSRLLEWGYMALASREVTNVSSAQAATRELIAKGVDGIKVHLQPPKPPLPRIPPEAVRVAVDGAHRAGKPVFVHPDKGSDVLNAIRCGVDVILHTTPRTGPWDETLLSAMTKSHVALTPTLLLWSSYPNGAGLTEIAVGQLRDWIARGGTVLYGSDLGAVDYDPRGEYALMKMAGMDFPQVLASLTTTPAECFGDSERLGRVAPGYMADLVVLERDPSDDLSALAEVRYTLRGGVVTFTSNE